MQQMTLGEMIATLKRKNPADAVLFDFVHFRPSGHIHSYRGIYEHLALDYVAGGDMTVGQLVTTLQAAVGKTFMGYKGGQYPAITGTVIW
jgi:hypothetical protein